MTGEGLLRVGFDGLYLEQPMTGSGQYAVHLWRELRGRASCLDARLLVPADAPRQVREEAIGPNHIAPPPALRGRVRKVWWEQRGIVRATRAARAELVHVPYFAAPLRQVVPHVVTIHDVIPLALPAYRGTARMQAYLRLVSRAARRARLVLTDSMYSRDDIVRHLNIPEHRLRVIPLGVSASFSPPVTYDDEEAVERLRQRYGLARPFVLNVGGFDQRKRLPQLVRGYAAALARLDEEYDLVIVGRAHTANSALYPPLDPLIRELGLTERVRLVGFVSEADKRDFYRAASVFAFASAYEGFGFDPLEAMACGAPVVCSNRTSLPEVVGDAGILVEPEPAAIADALVAVLESPDLRSDLSLRGIQRAKQFSWARCAEQTISAYADVVDPGGKRTASCAS